jgi:DNA-binding MarR family transcriptional regulator
MGDAPYEEVENGNKIETEISILIVNMYRYARVYSKKALENTPLQTVDEFGYLATLLTYNCLKKTELIAKNIHEKPTGMEIIKRLLQNGLIDQFDDEQDKRSKLVRLNDKGKYLLYSIFDKMGKVSDIVTGDLERDEKIQLLYFLKKLDRFHHHIFTNEKEEVLQTLT